MKSSAIECVSLHSTNKEIPLSIPYFLNPWSPGRVIGGPWHTLCMAITPLPGFGWVFHPPLSFQMTQDIMGDSLLIDVNFELQENACL